MMRNLVFAFVLFGGLIFAPFFCNAPEDIFRQPAATATALPEVKSTTVSEPTQQQSAQPAATQLPAPGGIPNRLGPTDLEYLGAFRLPADNGTPPTTFAYGGSAMTFNPDGDASGPQDGFSGSLFISGHPRMPYGELPNGDQIAEISIPVPVKAGSPAELSQSEFLQDFHDVARGFFSGLEEITRLGMVYIHNPLSGPKIHLAYGAHIQEDATSAELTHAWFEPDLANPHTTGTWSIGNQTPISVNGYMLEIPSDWAERYSGGRVVGTGRFKDGGWSGMGPALFAYVPWGPTGETAAPGTRLEETTLLLYEKSVENEKIEKSLKGYQHPDEWEGAAWITSPSGKQAVLFAGTKSLGEKYWYGYLNPAGAQYPCVDDEVVGQFPVCRLGDGSLCPQADMKECEGHSIYRGWWSTRFEAQFILYDPADLARVAAGEIQPWEPQPYASLSIDEHLFMNPSGVETDLLGSGVQRRYRIGEAGYDRKNGLLYVLEMYADEARPVVHVWRVR